MEKTITRILPNVKGKRFIRKGDCGGMGDLKNRINKEEHQF